MLKPTKTRSTPRDILIKDLKVCISWCLHPVAFSVTATWGLGLWAVLTLCDARSLRSSRTPMDSGRLREYQVWWLGWFEIAWNSYLMLFVVKQHPITIGNEIIGLTCKKRCSMYVWKLFLQLLGADDNGFDSDELRMNLDDRTEDEDEMPSCLFSAIIF